MQPNLSPLAAILLGSRLVIADEAADVLHDDNRRRERGWIEIRQVEPAK